ncbi:MAG: 4Fe-4S dicluster domain-containing protein [Candidatus Rokubacteria bacterium]|nr:4Fe-4S dicluster domain-containing protein [Candidatus Rokubacteria bacterium]MBI3825437.1 4Fe-4S dicluster domain-containing protein [Candidatus Rokubacteria bacterium]
MARTLAMFTDTSLCIGCRACQVACKQWNELGQEVPEWTGTYQNHAHFTDKTFRLVRFIEEPKPQGQMAWLLMSDVCKHCADAGCLNACPTGAIERTAFGTVNINQDVCNGCRYCVSACPFGVVTFNHDTGTAHKCSFCNDRIHNGLGPACAKACPTESIQFGFRDDLVAKATKRVAALQAMGFKEAQLYGADSQGFLGGLNAFFLLLAKPATYNLPDNPQVPQRNVVRDSVFSLGSALLVGLGAIFAFRRRGEGKESDHA